MARFLCYVMNNSRLRLHKHSSDVLWPQIKVVP